MTLSQLASPSVLIDQNRMDSNIREMQQIVNSNHVALWPHIKTHKMIPVLRRQLEAGAEGATCAKLGEAESLLPSGVKRIFIAFSLVQLEIAPRLRALSDSLDELILAVTSEAHLPALEALVAKAGISQVGVLLAVNTGLKREGVRTTEAAVRLAQKIRDNKRLKLRGIYTHEGQAYMTPKAELPELISKTHAMLEETAAAIGGEVPLWPGCSVTAARMALEKNVYAVRPGSYVFGDLSLTDAAQVMPWANAAASIQATVVDLPEPGLALIDAGTKVFSSDKNAEGLFAREREGRKLFVTRLSEEHGFITGEDVSTLKIGGRLRFIPAHICPVINLASQVHLVDGEKVLETWKVDARGRSD